jgi:hypothetical protein
MVSLLFDLIIFIYPVNAKIKLLLKLPNHGGDDMNKKYN